MQFNDILAALDIDLVQWKGNALTARSPLDGATLATLAVDTPADAERKIDAAHDAFLKWRTVPAPVRGEPCACSATCCASTRPSLAASSRSKPARSRRKASAKCRK